MVVSDRAIPWAMRFDCASARLLAGRQAPGSTCDCQNRKLYHTSAATEPCGCDGEARKTCGSGVSDKTTKLRHLNSPPRWPSRRRRRETRWQCLGAALYAFLLGASKHPSPQRQRLDGRPRPRPVVEPGTQGGAQLLAGALQRGPQGHRLRIRVWQASKHCPRFQIEKLIRGIQVAPVELC